MDNESPTHRYPTLSRPSRKLNFLPSNERAPKQWGGKVTLKDVDRLFDELDSSSDGFESVLPLSPMPKTTSEVVEKKTASPVEQKAPSTGNIQQSPMDPKGEFQQSISAVSAEPVENTEQNLETGSPFVQHGPIKTSSPLEGRDVDKEVRAVSPILFCDEDDDDVPEEEPKTASLSIERAQSQGPIQPSSEDVFDASPNVFSLPKAKTLQDVGDTLDIREPDPVATKSPYKSQSSPIPEPQLPSPAGPSQPAAVKTSRVPKERASSFLQKLRETSHPKSPRKSLVKEPSLPEEPTQEPEEDFLILEDASPAWFTIPRKKDPSTSKPRPAQQTTNNNNNDGELTSSDQGLEKAETQDTGHGGESASLEEGRTVNKKKEKASIPSLPSPKKSAAKKKTTTKGMEIATEMAEQEPSPASDLVDHGKDQEKKKKKNKKKQGSKRVTEKRPSPSMPQGQPPHHASPSQAVKLKAARTVANKKQRSSSVVKRSKSAMVHQEEEEEEEKEEKKKKMKSGMSVKGRRGEQRQLQSSNSEMKHFNMGPANTEVKPPLSTSCEEAGPSDASQALGKRRRKRPGNWWLSLDPEESDGPPALKSPKRPQTAAAEPLPAKNTQDGDPKETNKRTSTARRKGERKARKTTNRRGATGRMVKRGGVAGVTEEEEEIRSPEQEAQQVPDQVLDPGALSPVDRSSRLERPLSAKRLFDRTYQHIAKRNHTNEAVSIKGAPELENVAPDGRRKRKTPDEWWKLSDGHPEKDTSPPPTPPPPPQPRRQEARKGGKPQSKWRKSLDLAAAKTVTPQPSPTPSGVTTTTTAAGSTALKPKKMFPAPKTIKRSLATFQDIFGRTTDVFPPDAVKNAAREEPAGRKKSRKKILLSPPRERYPGGDNADMRDLDDLNSSGPPLIVEAPADSSNRRPSWPSSIVPTQRNKRLSDSMAGFHSGPSNMVHLEQHEENEDIFLPTTRTQHSDWLSLGLYTPPLVPMVLQDEDEANLREWLSVLWPAPAQAESSHAGPESFEWFCHRGRAIGLQVDMCSESLCNGKIILGSYMKKPLWVDHCATTVFYMSTSSVVLTVDATDSHYSAGQSFVVPCGHAYSIKNQGDEPVVMFFSWIQAESPE